MTSDRDRPIPGPDPDRTPGPGPGGGVPPGETPPVEDSISGAIPRDRVEIRKPWGRWPLVVVLVAGVLVAALLLVRAFDLLV
ncbi:DUF6480 family protein [Streptomyces sp. HB2AG]|uniref:DUF6480 family protein n=1 Tax=Streptomyces sp. HB2AG TaxID=2983400 RepID=UPI0022AAB0C5|nr:DUF6480 family protein [Streptomyces sp. HB2AG]MCZ2526393.1 DUF6480 family protein [Streptomyces sp. HB2AG]